MFQALLKKIAQKLSDKDIPYMVIGGQAVLLYGEPRLTKDIDITLGLGIEGLGKIKEVFESLSFKVLVRNPVDFVKKTMVLPVLDESSGIRVDFIFSFSKYEKQAIEKANEVNLDNVIVRFAALEDLVIHKIIAKRARDIEDVRSILLKNPEYDMAYIKKWLNEFDKSLDENFGELFNNLVENLA